MGTETSGVHSRRAPTHLADSREDRTLCGARPDAMRPPNLDGRSIHTSKVAQKCCIAIASAALACVNGRVRFQHDERTRTVPARRHRLAQRRKAVGLSQEALAEVMGVDRSTIVRWERAATEPQPWHRPRLARALKVSIEELAALLADVGEPSAPPSERLDYVLKHPASVDLLAVAYLRERLARLDEQYDHIPSTLLLAEAGQLYGQAVFLRERARSLVRRELLAAEVEAATLMGQLVWDASQRRDHSTATHFFGQAIAAARHRRDPIGEALAHLRLSYVALYGIGNPRDGLVCARRAATAAEAGSHVLAGLAMLHVGEANAMLGDDSSCNDALGVAEDHFAAIEPDDPAGVLFTPAEHGRLSGSCFLFLGRPDKAEPILETTRQMLKDQKKSTAIVLGNLALAGIRQRKVDAAVVRLHEAIDVVERNRGGGGLNVVFTAARELKPWRNEPVVQDVNDRLLALMTAA
jgi:transcriptional regulator with XRE-family HTH domain